MVTHTPFTHWSPATSVLSRVPTDARTRDQAVAKRRDKRRSGHPFFSYFQTFFFDLRDYALCFTMHRCRSLLIYRLFVYAVCLPRHCRVLGRRFEYGDAHASHSSLPHLEESDLACLMSRLGPDTILLALSCLLQVPLQ